MGSSKVPQIVVIDDDESVRNSTANLIKSLGYSVNVFCSAKAFLESHAIHAVSCLITDIHMPEMSGIELQRHLSAAGYLTPIIFMTAHPNDATRARLISDGAVGYLDKPFSPLSLKALLIQALNRDH